MKAEDGYPGLGTVSTTGCGRMRKGKNAVKRRLVVRDGASLNLARREGYCLAF